MKRVGYFITGGLVGALAALMLAPRAGADTRVLVVDKVNDVVSDIPGGSDVYDKAAKMYNEAMNKAAGVVSDIKKDVIGEEDAVEAEVEVVETQATTEDAKGDELRAKIEAARQRIASQVVKNAEETAEAAPVEEAAEEAAPAEEAPTEEAPVVEAEAAEEAAPAEEAAEEAAPAEEEAEK